MPVEARKETDIGKRIAARRAQRGLSQGAVSRRTGIDPSYLSRIENGKVHPTVRTALRIARALRMSLEDLVGPSPPSRKDHPCPVSNSGKCLMDLVDTGPGSEGRTGPESYSLRQLRLLRRFTRVLQHSNPPVLKALDVLFSEILENGKPKRA